MSARKARGGSKTSRKRKARKKTSSGRKSAGKKRTRKTSAKRTTENRAATKAASKRSTAKRSAKKPAKKPASKTRTPKTSTAGTRAAKTTRRPRGGPTRYSGFQVDDADIERLLKTGEYRGILEAYFGEAEYAELVELARRAGQRSVRGGPRVLLLPGIMGSKLGSPRKVLSFLSDTLWIDPVEIALGRLVELALPSRREIQPIGVMLFAYLKLKLRLEAAGFDAAFAPFDWRLSLDELGEQMNAHIQDQPAETVHLVAHSMGGLVARAALAAEGASRETSKVGRVVMLGTPNHGSFVPVQALRATLSTVSLMAGIDLAHDAEELSRRVFTTLPGLIQMLPFPQVFDAIDLYIRGEWPEGPAPRAALLNRAGAVQDGLAPADDRFSLIAGVNQNTTVGLRRDGGQFVYETSRAGDGTVPLAFAELPGATPYYVDAAHGRLPNNATVGAATIDLLARGETERLPKTFDRRRADVRRELREEELRATPYPVGADQPLGPREGRTLLDLFVSPESDDERSGRPASPARGEGPSDADLDQVVVSRRRQRALEIRLARGSITEVDTRALVLGLFRDVAPAGAARAVDSALGGAVKAFTDRRMFTGHVGEVFVLPTGRSRVFAESVLFAGLGPFDTFDGEVQEFVAENVVRTFVRTHVEDFATVLIGAGSGHGVRGALTHQLRGYLRGLLDTDSDQRFRRITLCENNVERFAEIKAELVRLTSTALFADVSVTLDDVVLPDPAPAAAAPGRRATDAPGLVYLIVSQTENENPAGPAPREVNLRASLLTATDRREAKAAVLSGNLAVPVAELDAIQRATENDLSPTALGRLGDRLVRAVLTPEVQAGLHAMRGNHLVVIHDAGQPARIPWEVMRVQDFTPAAELGLSRRYSADKLSVAKWLEARQEDEVLDVLLVVNPTGDLDGAVDEAERIRELFGETNPVRLHRIEGSDATRRTLLEEFSSGRYDVLHYAGHAFFDGANPQRSGLVCAGEEVLSGAQLATLSNLPALAFFNACESGRTRGAGTLRGDDPARRGDMGARIARNVGLAEAFLRGGIANYIGTYWPVGDRAASAFAAAFYGDLVRGHPIGAALQRGRDAVRATDSIDWADYIHYGSFDFVLKRRGQEPLDGPDLH